ncbi:MAG TPA: hypothetical protein VN603_03990 [Candidatus Acidoferrales bacterium]|nr:hypothetical protein [Candidatus Acidoferrales bacterium]
MKYCSLTSHSAITYILVANAEAWQRLPKNLQAIAERELNAAATAATSGMAGQEGTIETTLRSEGMAFNRPVLDPFRRVIRDSGLYAQWRDRFDPTGWAALEKTPENWSRRPASFRRDQ